VTSLSTLRVAKSQNHRDCQIEGGSGPSNLKHHNFGYRESGGKEIPKSRDVKRRLDRNRRSREELDRRSRVIVISAIRGTEVETLPESGNMKS
jgi:hypothetical protein